MYQPQYDPFYPNMAVIKKYFKSKLVLAEGILHIVFIAVSLISALVLTLTTFKMITPEFFEMIKDSFSSADFASADFPSIRFRTNLSPNITSYISPALLAFSSLFIYFKSKNDKPESNPSVGFLVKYIAAMVGMIVAIVATATVGFCFALFSVLSAVLSSTEGGSREGTLMMGMIITAIAMMVVMLLYSIFRFQFIKSVRLGFKQPKLEAKSAKAYGVTSILYTIFTPICLVVWFLLFYFLIASLDDTIFVKIGEYINISVLIPYGMIQLVSFGVNLAIAIVDAKIAFGYHKYVDDINSGRLVPEIPEVEYIAPPESIFEETAPPVYTADHTAFPQTGAPDPAKTPNHIPSPSSFRYCAYCGNILSEGSVFCSHCGNKVQ